MTSGKPKVTKSKSNARSSRPSVPSEAARSPAPTVDEVDLHTAAPNPPAMRPKPKRSTRRRAAEPFHAQDGASVADSLLQALVEGAAVASTADALLNIYRDSSAEVACCAVLNLVGKAAGVAQAELDGTALRDDADITALLEEMYARVPEDSAAYLLVNKETKYRTFRRIYPEFFERLVELSYSGNVLLDGVLLPTLLHWLIAMSESKARCFRHTATSALLGMVQGLNKLMEDLNGRLALVQAKQQLTDLQDNINDITGWRDHIFAQAIHQRLRDVAPEIRLSVFQSLKGWILDFPGEFVANKYLRYFGMPLHDKRPEIRAEGLNMILEALARTPDARNRMFLFLQYFANRLVEMSGDVDVRCAELAIRVIALIVRADSEVAEGGELMSNEMIDRVLLTLFDERPTIRAAAGVLLKVFLHCRTAGEADAAAQTRASTELLCVFAATLRAQYGETEAERYLIDALWTPERPPTLLTSHAPLLRAAASPVAAEAAVGLALVAALLARLRGPLAFGPPPKDDRRAAAGGRRERAALHEATGPLPELSREAAALLPDAMERHGGDADVLCAAAAVVAAMDLRALTGPRWAEPMRAALSLLRAGCAGVRYAGADTDGRLAQLAAAWHALTQTDHPLREEATGQLHELLRPVLRQLTQTTRHASAGRRHSQQTSAPSQPDEEASTDGYGAALHVWTRVSLAAALVPLGEQWGVLKAALVERSRPEQRRLALAAAVRCVMWQLQPDTDSTEAAALVGQRIGEMLSCLFHLWSRDAALPDGGEETTSDGAMDASLAWHADSFIALCDLCALPHFNMSQSEQETLMERFGVVVEALGRAVRGAQEALKAAVVKLRADPTSPAALCDVVRGRRLLSRHEATLMRVVAGVARLIVLRRLADDLTPRVLLQWTHASARSVSGLFKGLFHAMRERAGDSFGLEKDILVAAYHHCVAVGATPASVEALYQIGWRLAALHFLLADKYYPACVSVVRFGVQFAMTTDPMILQAVTAYCPKLRQQDALEMAHWLAGNEMFATGSNPFVRSFVAALRRAARLEDAMSTPGKSLKRPRDATVSQSHEADPIFAALAQRAETSASPNAKGPSKSRSRRQPATGQEEEQKRHQPQPPRTVTNDGWHIRLDDEAALSAALAAEEASSMGKQRGKRGKPQTEAKETTLSSLAAELDNEVFIATQEYD